MDLVFSMVSGNLLITVIYSLYSTTAGRRILVLRFSDQDIHICFCRIKVLVLIIFDRRSRGRCRCDNNNAGRFYRLPLCIGYDGLLGRAAGRRLLQIFFPFFQCHHSQNDRRNDQDHGNEQQNIETVIIHTARSVKLILISYVFGSTHFSLSSSDDILP